ncbi:MAG: alpha/beta hydrolase domain-containing protein [Gemmatimonadota bacterium]
MSGRLTLLVAMAAALFVLVPPSGLRAEVVRVEIERREEVLDGHRWGEVGPYEKLVGRIFFAFDPENEANAAIVDLGLAPRNGDGRVEAYAEFMVLQPVDRADRRGVAWLEVSNRGGKASLRYFHRASRGTLDPVDEDDFGDGLFFREGLTLIWVGWQWDVPEREGLLRLHVPFARDPGGPVTGLVRADWTVDATAEVLDLAHRGHRAYAASDPQDPANILTVRDGREAPREVIPRDQWEFEASTEGPESGRLTRIRLEGGFEAGRIYELVYRSEDPRIVGLGLAAIRDVASYAKYDLQSVFPSQQVVAFGVSQTGRFLRHYLYQGFNVDEGGRKAIDGMLVHTAGAGRGSFNHRFGQPSRDAHRYSAFFYPTDIFPFTSRTQTDAVTGVEDGLLASLDEDHRPRVFFTNTGYEYWGRAASLIHTSSDGDRDVLPLQTERIYHLASGQHSVGRFPPGENAQMAEGIYRGNPLDFLLPLRALALDLVYWVRDDITPPPSRYPSLGEGTLTYPEALALPAVPGLIRPEVVHVAYRANYGLRFRTQGIIDREPPELGPPFPALVPQVDGIGNELSGVRSVEIRVPLATYLPWNLRTGAVAAQDELTDFTGTLVPLSRTEEERAGREDPRPSIQALYRTRGAYLNRVRLAAGDLVEEGFLLPEDLAAVVTRAQALWDWIHSNGQRP